VSVRAETLRSAVSARALNDALADLRTVGGWWRLVLRLRAFVAFLTIVIVFSVISSDYFTGSNLLTMTEHVAVTGPMAIGETFVILTAGIDLSVGSIAGLIGMVAGALLNNGLILHPLGIIIYFNVPIVVLIGLGLGGGIGAINATVVTRFRVAPFIATLGMLSVARGLADLSDGGNTFANLGGTSRHGNTGFGYLAGGKLLGIPFEIVLFVFVVLVATFVAKRTAFGRRVYAVGGNERAAELAGIRVKRVKYGVYMISGVCAALTGLLITSELASAFPDTATSYELNAIAAVVLGGTSLFGGRGRIGGTVLGAFVIGFLNDGLVLVGVSSFWQQVAQGLVIVTAVAVDEAQRRRRAASATEIATATAEEEVKEEGKTPTVTA
jgi:erythritol transport system permease protein